jgi:hypothetical protein
MPASRWQEPDCAAWEAALPVLFAIALIAPLSQSGIRGRGLTKVTSTCPLINGAAPTNDQKGPAVRCQRISAWARTGSGSRTRVMGGSRWCWCTRPGCANCQDLPQAVTISGAQVRKDTQPLPLQVGRKQATLSDQPHKHLPFRDRSLRRVAQLLLAPAELVLA